MHDHWIWIISIISILGVLFRPMKSPEWVWAIAGALALGLTQLISPRDALGAIGKGVDVYFFLAGMMLLSELSRREGLFDWLASLATHHARGSARRLFFLIYGAGVMVTIFLSNDATAVVLTPAVYAAVKKAGAKPLPYLFACALVANAASFVLPISNPANLVVFGKHMPRLMTWITTFGLPSVMSITATLLVLYFWFLSQLRAPLKSSSKAGGERLKGSGKVAAVGLLVVIAVLIFCSTIGVDLGMPTFGVAVVLVVVVAFMKKTWPTAMLKEVSWSVIPLVAGLFVIVEATERAGALDLTRVFLNAANAMSGLSGKLLAAFGFGLSSNFVNNLPIGLIGGTAVQTVAVSGGVRNATLIGVDLGPNLSVTGSLATILWLMALRREGQHVSGWSFFKLGLIAMPVALFLSVLFI